MPTPGAILLVDDEDKILKTLGARAPCRRAPGGRGRQRAGGATAARSAGLRPRHRRQPDARRLRARSHSRDRRLLAGERAPAGRHDDGPRDGGARHRGDEARRTRFPAEAVRDRRAAGRGQPGDRSSAAPHPSPLPDRRARRSVRSLRHRRPQPGDAGGHRACGAGRRDAEHRAHHRRDRHGQGARGARHPRSQRAARDAAHQGELRRHPGDAARIRALRPRARRVHRVRWRTRKAGSPSPTAARSCSTRSRRSAPRCRRSCCACCRSASSSRSGRSAPSASTSA